MYTNTPAGFEFRSNSNQWPVVSDSVVINYTSKLSSWTLSISENWNKIRSVLVKDFDLYYL